MFKKLIIASLIALGSGKQHRHKHHNKQIQTVTTTKTVTASATNTGIIGSPIIYVTKTLSCEPTSIPNDNNDNDNYDDSQTECLSYFNKFRASQNLPAFEQASPEQIECANKAAVNDAKMGYHNSFYQRMCPNAASQNECMNGVNGGGLKNCIDAYISEGPPGTQGAYPEQNHGHWITMAGPYKSVACGTDGKGFFTHNFYN